MQISLNGWRFLPEIESPSIKVFCSRTDFLLVTIGCVPAGGDEAGRHWNRGADVQVQRGAGQLPWTIELGMPSYTFLSLLDRKIRYRYCALCNIVHSFYFIFKSPFLSVDLIPILVKASLPAKRICGNCVLVWGPLLFPGCFLGWAGICEGIIYIKSSQTQKVWVLLCGPTCDPPSHTVELYLSYTCTWGQGERHCCGLGSGIFSADRYRGL